MAFSKKIILLRGAEGVEVEEGHGHDDVDGLALGELDVLVVLRAHVHQTLVQGLGVEIFLEKANNQMSLSRFCWSAMPKLSNLPSKSSDQDWMLQRRALFVWTFLI